MSLDLPTLETRTPVDDVSRAVELNPFATLAVDNRERIVAANPALAACVGWPLSRVLGHRLRDLLAWPGGLEGELLSATGPQTRVRVGVSEVAAPAGWRVISVVPVASVQADQDVATLVERSIVATMLLTPVADGDGAVVDFEIALANERAAELNRVELPSLIGQRLRRWLETPELERLFHAYVGLLGNSEPLRVDVAWTRGGRHVADLEINAVGVPEGVLVGIREVVDVSLATERLRAAQAELEAADAQQRRLLTAQRDFVSMISHELRTPVAAVLGFAELVCRNPDLDVALRADVMDAILRNARRQARIFDQLLDACELSEGELGVAIARVPVGSVVHEAIVDVPPVAGRVRVDLQPGLQVLADEARLLQVLVSYLSNAVKYGGAEIVVSAEAAGADVVIRVTDDGPGVPEDLRDELFEMFTQGGHPRRRTARGVGLGLHLARGMARAMGGSVGYEPVEPHGSTFSVRLPRG